MHTISLFRCRRRAFSEPIFFSKVSIDLNVCTSFSTTISSLFHIIKKLPTSSKTILISLNCDVSTLLYFLLKEMSA